MARREIGEMGENREGVKKLKAFHCFLAPAGREGRRQFYKSVGVLAVLYAKHGSQHDDVTLPGVGSHVLTCINKQMQKYLD